MNRINKIAGTTITIYHTFHDEVRYYKTHVWRCDGPCQHRPPYYGIVKRSMNRYVLCRLQYIVALDVAACWILTHVMCYFDIFS